MKFDVKKMVRATCEGFEPYRAGKPIETVKRELGLKRVIKMASNENPLGACPGAVAAIRNSAARSLYYPDANSWMLKQALAKKYAVDPGIIMVGAGSDELIELIGKAFFNKGENIVISQRSFIRYAMAAKLMECSVTAVPMKDGFTHDLEAMARAVTAKTKAVFITNPNNPTGTYNTAEECAVFLKTMERRFPSRPPLVVMDEAYYEYARVNPDYPDTLPLLKRYPNLVILRTFSKIYALAGLRVGYGFAASGIVDYIDRIRPPFNINIPAQEAAVASLSDKNQVARSVAMVEQGKLAICSELDRLGMPFVPSAANFVLMDVSPLRGADAFAKILKHGVIVRAMDEYQLPHHIRVTIGTPAQNKLFLAALKKVMSQS